MNFSLLNYQATLDSGKLDLDLVSAGSNGIAP